MSETPVIGDAAEPAPAGGATGPAVLPWSRLFFWSVRRELWENRAIWIAPAAVAAIVVAGFALSSAQLAATVRHAAASGVLTPEALKLKGRALGALFSAFGAAAGAPALAGLIVSIFYCLASLNGERRDRSLLFWKSLPVSDAIAVAAKAFTAIVIQPLASLAVIAAAQALMLILGTVVVLVNGVDPGLFWSSLKLREIWTLMPYGLLLNGLWYAPVYGWLLLVSAFAKRMTFVWAIAVPAGAALFEFMTLHSTRVLALLNDRLMTGYAQAFSVGGKGQVPINDLSQVDPGRFFALPGLWGGLLFLAIALVACVWLRRRHDPI